MTAADWPIIKEIALIFGFIMRGIYLVLSYFGIHSIPICILTFVVISKIIILPSTYKKQKFAVLVPKLLDKNQSIIDKYKNKLDHPLTKNKINVDRGYLLTRYGIASSTSITMTLLQIPILLALYAIVQNMERYVPELNNLTSTEFTAASTIFGMSINEVPGFALTPALVFPILTALLQLVEMLQMSLVNKVANNGKLAGGISNALMVGMMFYFSAEFPIVCALYWIIRSVCDIVITFFIQLYVKHKDLSYFEMQKLKKDNKLRIRKKLEPITSPIC